MEGASALVAQSASTAYKFCKDMFLYTVGQKRDIESLEEKMSKLINLMISIKSEKGRIDQFLMDSPFMEPSQAYTVMEAEIEVIEKKYTKLKERYTIKANNHLGSPRLNAEAASSMNEKLADHEMKIARPDFLRLAELSRDVSKLSVRASEAFKGLRLEKMTLYKSVPKQKKLKGDGHILPVYDRYVGEVLHYLFEEEGNTIGILGCQGAGKTTVLRKLFDRLLQQESLDNIIYIEYPPKTETADAYMIVEVLQKEIMIQLYIDHEAGISTLKNADIISTFLRKKKYMLLIDDASSAIDLEILGFKKE